jgi:glycosyltransferase involved in cell wall biosynthesis
MSALKVCIVTTSFPRWLDDSRGTFVYEAAQALSEHNVRVRVVAMHNPGAKTREWLGPIEVIRPRYMWPERWEILQKEGGGLPVMWQSNRLTGLILAPFLIAHFIAIARYARGFDVVHANWTLSAAVALAARVVHKRPVAVTVHGSDLVRATRLPFVKSITREVLRRCDRVLAVSSTLAKMAIALGVPVSCVQVMPNSVDIRQFSPPDRDREPVMLFVGSLAEIKGIRFLIQAVPAVRARWPEYRLVVVGEGPLRAELAALAETLGVSSAVQFLGPLPPGQVRDWMRRARLLVLPSLEEGFGVVLIEALACGTPSVASRIGGIPDVIVPEVGVLVPPADVEALTQGISSILALSPVQYAEVSRLARRRAEIHFSRDIIARMLMDVYRSVLTRSA